MARLDPSSNGPKLTFELSARLELGSDKTQISLELSIRKYSVASYGNLVKLDLVCRPLKAMLAHI